MFPFKPLIYLGGNIWQEVKAVEQGEEPKLDIGKNEEKRELKPSSKHRLLMNDKL